MHINSVFAILTQMGVGPTDGFSISGDTEKWSDFISDNLKVYSMVKSYVYLKVRLLFDPPQSSSAVESINRQISEFEWRLYIEQDPVNSQSQYKDTTKHTNNAHKWHNNISEPNNEDSDCDETDKPDAEIKVHRKNHNKQENSEVTIGDICMNLYIGGAQNDGC